MKIFEKIRIQFQRGRALLKDFVIGDNLFYGSPVIYLIQDTTYK